MNKMKMRQKLETKTKTSSKPKQAAEKKVLPKWNIDEGNKKLNYNPESKPEYDVRNEERRKVMGAGQSSIRSGCNQDR